MLRKQPFGNSAGIKGNLYNETNSGMTERGSVVMVLSKNGNDRNTVWSYQFSHVLAGNQPDNKYDASWHLRAAASRAEDIDHDGSMEIVTAGVGEESKTTTKELTFNIDAKGGGGLGGFKFGLSGGSSSGSSASSISTEGIERSGTVHDLPTVTTGYSFQWQFVVWETTLTTGGLSYNVPVLSYLVANVKQPPNKPQNLEAKNGKYTLTDTEVQPSTVSVCAQVGRHGRNIHAAYQDGSRIPVTGWTANNTLVPGTYRITASEGSKVIFTATPAKNYQVWKWTVKSGAQVLTENTDYTLSTDKKTLTVSSLQKNLDVHVEFSNQFYTVSAQSDTYGSVTATANGNPLAATSVLSGTEVTFTAAPKKDYVVKQWTVTRDGKVETQKNTDGTVFSGSELKLTITANTVVNVTFEQTAQFEVHYSAVDQEDTNKEIALNFETTGLTDGKGEKGSTVTLTAKPSSAMGIAGWQYKTSESDTWINSSVTGLSYTIRNLQSNIWVRALVNDNAKPTTVNFGVVDENGHAVEGGTLTAKNGSNTFDSGAKQPAGLTIVFTATPKDGYQVEGWYTAANGSTAITGTASEQNSYTLTNLTNAANVYVAFEKIPTYDITVDTTGRGRVTATVNGAKADITDGTFRPNAAVTREQAAAILYRCAQSKNIDVSVGENTNILSFADAQQASEYAIPALQWAVGAGVLSGKSGNLLAPTGTATRAEIAAIMQRWCEKIVQK